jgi:hypothetical protein
MMMALVSEADAFVNRDQSWLQEIDTAPVEREKKEATRMAPTSPSNSHCGWRARFKT